MSENKEMSPNLENRMQALAEEKYYCGGDLPDSIIYEAAAANQAYQVGFRDCYNEISAAAPPPSVDEMAEIAREGKDLHYGGYREVAQALQSQLSSMTERKDAALSMLAEAKKNFDVMVANDTRQEAAIEKLTAERDAALKEVGEYRNAIDSVASILAFGNPIPPDGHMHAELNFLLNEKYPKKEEPKP